MSIMGTPPPTPPSPKNQARLKGHEFLTNMIDPLSGSEGTLSPRNSFLGELWIFFL